MIKNLFYFCYYTSVTKLGLHKRYLCPLEIGIFKNPGSEFLICVHEKSRSEKVQDYQKMPGSGLRIKEKYRLDLDPDQSVMPLIWLRINIRKMSGYPKASTSVLI